MKGVERDIGEELRQLFDGDTVSPSEFENYRFLRVKPINGDRRMKEGEFAIRQDDGIVYRVGAQVGKTRMLKEVPVRIRDDVHTLLYMLRQGQNTDGHYLWAEIAVPGRPEEAQTYSEASDITAVLK